MRTTSNKNQNGSTAQFTQIAKLVGSDSAGQAKMPEQKATARTPRMDERKAAARIMELLQPVAHSLAGDHTNLHLGVLGQLARGEALPGGKLGYNWKITCTILATLPVDLVPQGHAQWKKLRKNQAEALSLACEQVGASSKMLHDKAQDISSKLAGRQFNPDQKRLF